MSRPKLTPQIAYNLARRLYMVSGECDTRLESVIAQEGEWAYLYAKHILRGPWPEAEISLSKDPSWAYWYARDVLKAPFPEAEPAIAQDSGWTKEYLRKMLKTEEDRDRFREVQRWVARS